MQEQVKPLFPAQSTKKQHERLRSSDRVNIRGDVAVGGSGFVNSIGNNCEAWESPTKALKLRGFELRCQMYGGCLLDIRWEGLDLLQVDGQITRLALETVRQVEEL